MREFFITEPAQDGWVINLVAVQVQNRQHRAITHWINKFIGMPARCQWPSLSFTIADDAAHQQIRIVEYCSGCMCDRVAQFSAFVDGSRRLRRDVTGNSSRKRELLEQPLQARFI